jgi:hypothetical protein
MLYMGRALKKQARTEYHDVLDNQDEFVLLGAPIDVTASITLVNNTDTPRDFTDSSDVVESKYYFPTANQVCERSHDGIIKLNGKTLSVGVHALKITYTGGMAADTASFISAYNGLALAIAGQVYFDYQQKGNQGLLSEAFAGMSVTRFQQNVLLPDVERKLRQYARWAGEAM